MIQSISLNNIQVPKLTEPTPIASATPAELTQTFGQYLEKALGSVSAQEQSVHKLNDQYLIGQVDVTKVLIAAEQAQLGLQLTSQIRNKAVEAYQEMMRMQI